MLISDDTKHVAQNFPVIEEVLLKKRQFHTSMRIDKLDQVHFYRRPGPVRKSHSQFSQGSLVW